VCNRERGAHGKKKKKGVQVTGAKRSFKEREGPGEKRNKEGELKTSKKNEGGGTRSRGKGLKRQVCRETVKKGCYTLGTQKGGLTGRGGNRGEKGGMQNQKQKPQQR